MKYVYHKRKGAAEATPYPVCNVPEGRDYMMLMTAVLR